MRRNAEQGTVLCAGVEGHNAMGDTNTTRHLLRHPAWIMGGIVVLAFIAGPMVDVDHPIAWMVGIADGRFLMPHFDVASYVLIGSGLIVAIACLCRYSRLRLLRRVPGKERRRNDQ